jgi:hypothetical protein
MLVSLQSVQNNAEGPTLHARNQQKRGSLHGCAVNLEKESGLDRGDTTGAS